MILLGNRLAAATAVAAAVSLSAAPAAAVELPRVAAQAEPWDADALNAADHRHRGHHDDWDDDDWDVDGDDILTGVLILGGLAAIAGIANSGRHQQPQHSYPEPEPLPDDAAFEPPPRATSYRSGGMAQAVDTCVAEVEDGRGAVSSVDRASRSGEGWYVAGEIDGGTPFACWIDGAGRVTDLEAGDASVSLDAPADGARPYDTVHKQAVEEAPGDSGQLALAAD